MKIQVAVQRIAKVRVSNICAAVGLESSSPSDRVIRALKEEFGPLNPSISFFWPFPPQEGGKDHYAIAGIDAMRFDVDVEGLPVAGTVEHEPLDPRAIALCDGILKGELDRLGLPARPHEFEWRTVYSVKK